MRASTMRGGGPALGAAARQRPRRGRSRRPVEAIGDDVIRHVLPKTGVRLSPMPLMSASLI